MDAVLLFLPDLKILLHCLTNNKVSYSEPDDAKRNWHCSEREQIRAITIYRRG